MVQRSQWKRLDCSASHLDKGCGSVWEGCDDRNDEHYFDHVRCTQDGMNDLIRAVVAGSERGADGEDVLGRNEEEDDGEDEDELDEAGDDDDDDDDDSDDEGDERLAAAKGEIKYLSCFLPDPVSWSLLLDVVCYATIRTKAEGQRRQ